MTTDYQKNSHTRQEEREDAHAPAANAPRRAKAFGAQTGSASQAESGRAKPPHLDPAPGQAESGRTKPPHPDPASGQAESGRAKPSHLDPASGQRCSGDERQVVCDVQFRHGGKIYFFDPAGLNLKNGDHVILDTSRGAEFGYCIIGNHKIARRELDQPLRRVLRLATPADERIKADNERKEKEAYAFCLKKVEELGLDMQLVSVEYAFDGSKLLFFFTADARVDFRELVRILAANFRTRIELRQIGVRDKAKMMGGLGICGRPFCCASFLGDFQPVSIKMAKTQSLSLNPTKISGACGRLMCCLKYEQDTYEDLIKTSPKLESFVDTPDGRGTVTSVNLMRQSVCVRMEKDADELHSYRNCEICVLRNGKPRKTDPPIPEDLAPISGRRAEGPIRERYSRLEQRLTVEADETDEMEPEWESFSGEAEPSAQERSQLLESLEASMERLERKSEQSRRRKSTRSAERDSERAERTERIEVGIKPNRNDKSQPSRQQRRRQHQGRPELKIPHSEQPRRPAPEKRQEEQFLPKTDASQKPNRRRNYHNRKPKGN